MTMKDKQQRMNQLVTKLNEARRTYEQENHSIMSDFEYDKLYDELAQLENELGFILSTSPTVNVGYQVVSELPKEQHEKPMLSLDKTKEVVALKDFLGEREGVISWKLDGLTVVLTYRGGQLMKGVTRGSGEVGEVITNNVKTFKDLPLLIPFQGELIVRGEAVISFSDFNRLNQQIEDVDAKYKNPRNLCSGSVRQLNSEVTAKRNVHFVGFAIIKSDNLGKSLENSRKLQLDWLEKQGFQVVEHYLLNRYNVEEVVADFSKRVADFDLPTDGLVLTYDDISYGESLGSTSKFPRDSLAFKWADELKETTLKEIEWNASRTGLINPVAIFDAVELEGTSVSRASVHNLSIMEELELGVGDKIEVYKANMIIPQIANNLTRSGNVVPPKHCLVCGIDTVISMDMGSKTLRCPNPHCQAKAIKTFNLFVSRDALNIEGLSEATIEKFVEKGFIKEIPDFFGLSRFKEEIVEMEGFGEKSYNNLMNSLEKAKRTTLPKLIYGLGINHVGLATAKEICKAALYDSGVLMAMTYEDLVDIDGVGSVIAKSITDYFADEYNRNNFIRLLEKVEITGETIQSEQTFAGQTFVITGNVQHFVNRNEIKEVIEARGGKVSGSVSAKTDYLINNEITSSSSKNKKARELGIPIISEEAFLQMLN
jgi:DNA ligase (NAD+)